MKKNIEKLYFEDYGSFVNEIISKAVKEQDKEDKNYSYRFNKKSGSVVIATKKSAPNKHKR